jgi:anti-anti-sigma factor
MARRVMAALSSPTEDGGRVTTLSWTGEIDLTKVPDLRDEIMALPTDRPVRLDMSTVSYLDSSGLGMLVLLRNRLAGCGAAVTLVDVQPQVRRVLDITGLARAFLFGHTTSDGAPVLDSSRSEQRPPARGGLDIETTTNADGVWVHIRGETDMSTYEQLVAGLAAVHLDGAKVIHVDLSGLEFCDVRSLCHLLVFTSGVQRNGGEVVVHGASPMVLKMVNLLGVEDQPRFAA